jgi:transcription initiation factor TFIIB
MVVDIALKKIFIDTSKDDKNNDNAVSILQKPVVCSICKSNNVITDPESAEIVCSKCGMVISDKIQETRQESRTFLNNKAEDRRRTGMPTSLARSDMGLSTVIGWTNKDSSGHRLDEAMHSRMQRLRTWDSRIHLHTSVEKSLKQAFNELNSLKDKLGLSDVIVEKTAYIYRKAEERALLHGRAISSILAAAVYIACREMGMPRTLNEIAASSNIKLRTLAMDYRLLVKKLDLEIPLVDPIICTAKIANKANLTEKTKRHAMNIMHDVIKREISAGKRPMALAASVIYLSVMNTGENKTQRDIARAAGVSEFALRTRIQDLKNRLD